MGDQQGRLTSVIPAREAAGGTTVVGTAPAPPALATIHPPGAFPRAFPRASRSQLASSDRNL